MAESQQVADTAMDGSDKPWDKNTQAEYTRKMQRLADLERRMAEGEIVEKGAYDKFVVDWASKNPDEALDWLQLKNQQPSAGGSNGTQAESPFGEFDDSIFDNTSDAHKRFVQEHGEKGLRQAQFAKLAPELLEVTGIGRTISALQEQLKVSQDEIAALREQSEQAEKYSVAAFDKAQLLSDPRLVDVRKTITELQEDKNKWFDIVQKVKRVDELEAQLKELQSKAPSPVQPVAAQSPEQVAARIEQASVVPQGAGSSPGDAISRSIDPFDAAVLKVRPDLAGQYGLPASRSA